MKKEEFIKNIADQVWNLPGGPRIEQLWGEQAPLAVLARGCRRCSCSRCGDRSTSETCAS